MTPSRPQIIPDVAKWMLVALTATIAASCTTTSRSVPLDRYTTPAVAGDDGIASVQQARHTVDQVAKQAPDQDSFSRLLSSTGSISDTPLYKDSRAELLIDGPATYRRMLEAIQVARRYIYLETYIFSDDQVGEKFAEALAASAAAGVEVRVIYDSVGSMSSSEKFFQGIEDAGIQMIEFHAVNPIEGGNPLDINTRDHRKLLIVDGRIAFTGGINFSNSYASSAPRSSRQNKVDEGWRDTHVAIYGPAVAGFENVFRQQWIAHGGSPDSLSGDRPEPDRAGDDLIAVLKAEGGDGEESSIYRAYMEAMETASERIWITQAYFAPDKAFLQQLKNAAGRGVDVRVFLPGFTDSSLMLHASRSRYGELLKHGVKIYENTSSVLHAKTAIIDGVWSTVGSSNLDTRSFLHNDEINAFIFGAHFGGQMEKQYIQDISNARLVQMDEWKRRPFSDKIKEYWSWALEYWL
jgi:cardiolipin synthase